MININIYSTISKYTNTYVLCAEDETGAFYAEWPVMDAAEEEAATEIIKEKIVHQAQAAGISREDLEFDE